MPLMPEMVSYIRRLRRRIRELEDEVTRIEDRRRELRSQMREMRRTVRRLRREGRIREAERLEKRIRSLRAVLGGLTRKINRLEREREELERELKLIFTEVGDVVRVDSWALEHPPARYEIIRLRPEEIDEFMPKRVVETYANVRSYSPSRGTGADYGTRVPYAFLHFYEWINIDTRDLVNAMMRRYRYIDYRKGVVNGTYFHYYIGNRRLIIAGIPTLRRAKTLKWHYVEPGKEKIPVYITHRHLYVRREDWEKKPHWCTHVAGTTLSILKTLGLVLGYERMKHRLTKDELEKILLELV